jgi:hypothetical protein
MCLARLCNESQKHSGPWKLARLKALDGAKLIHTAPGHKMHQQPFVWQLGAWRAPFIVLGCLTFLSATAGLRGTNTAPTAAPSKPAAAAPRPALPASVKSYFAGQWTGVGKFMATGKIIASTLSFQSAADGEAILVTHAEKAPNKFAYSALISIDSKDGSPVMLLAGNNTGGARLFRGVSWEGNLLVFKSSPELRAWFAFERITFAKVDPDSFQTRYEFSQDGGNTWHVGDEQTFKRNSDPP